METLSLGYRRTRLAAAALILAGGMLSGQHAFSQEAAPPEIKGAPLDAPVDSGAAPKSGVSDAKPLGRALPQESLDLLQQMESDAKSGKDPMKFEKTRDGKYLKVTFNALSSFKYELPDPDALLASPDPTKPLKDQLPGPLKKLNKQPVVIVGFMVPVEIDNQGNVKSFALTQNQMFCCFGVPPAMNEWVMVSVGETPVKYYSDLPIAAFGSMEVGEQIEDGYVMSVYRMTADKVMDVRELLKQAKAGS
ncbi:MAG: DUF3299 domain-containing protein [Candidatus Hydrogenedentes bacterium]|nr:DUF3299 domain-containing protein [Candidatus Hydrogenedentota bacterium]